MILFTRNDRSNNATLLKYKKKVTASPEFNKLQKGSFKKEDELKAFSDQTTGRICDPQICIIRNIKGSFSS